MNPSNPMKFSFSNWTTPLDYHYDYRAQLSEDRLTIINPDQAKLLDEHIEVLGIIHLSVKGNWNVLAERLKRPSRRQ